MELALKRAHGPPSCDCSPVKATEVCESRATKVVAFNEVPGVQACIDPTDIPPLSLRYRYDDAKILVCSYQ